MGLQNQEEPFIRHNPFPDRLSTNGGGWPDEYVELYNLTVPSLRLQDVFNDRHIRTIMDHHVTVVVVMVGMVDIASLSVPNPDRGWYYREMLRITDQFRARAKALYPTEYDHAYVSSVIIHWSYLHKKNNFSIQIQRKYRSTYTNKGM